MRVGLVLSLAEVNGAGVPQPYSEIRALARHAEGVGLDGIWLADHLLGPEPSDAASSPWESWSVLCGLAEATSTVRLGTLVLCTAFRAPGVVARMADTLTEMSGGRLVLGLGAGWNEAEFHAFGLPFDYRTGRFADAVRVITGMLRQGRATFAGPFHSIHEAPVRERPGRVIPSILVAGRGACTLRLTAEYADIWNTAWYTTPDENFLMAEQELVNVCEKIGRPPETIQRTVGIRVAAPGALGGVAPNGTPMLPGEAPAIAEALAAWQAKDVAEAICWVDRCDRSAVDLVAEAAALHRSACST